MIKQNWKSCLAAVAIAIAAYSLGLPGAMAQVPTPPATPDLPDVETPAPPADTDTKVDAEANVQTDAKADVQADAKANLQTDADVDAPANKTNINAETDTDVQVDPNAPADTNLRNRTRANTQLDQPDASRPPRLDADSRLQTDTEADLDSRRTDQGQATAGTSQRGRLGIQFSGDDGLAISQVASGGIAARAGLRIRDEIVSINGRPVTTRDDLTLFINEASRQQGPTIIEFRRNGQLQQVNVNLMSTDDRGDRVQSFYRGPDDGGQPVYQNGGGNGGRYYYSSRRSRGRHCHRR